jgi:hypothetical protein
MSSTYTARSPGRKRRLPPHVPADEIRRNGATAVDITTTNHVALRGVNGQRLTVVTSCTPSDHRAIHKARSDIRRIKRGVPR